MAELISIRVIVFFLAFFALRPVMFMLIERPNRAHGLGLLGVSTLLAFLASSLFLDDPLGETLLAWLVIYVIIAVLWFARWKGQEYERVHRSRRESEETSDARRDES